MGHTHYKAYKFKKINFSFDQRVDFCKFYGLMIFIKNKVNLSGAYSEQKMNDLSFNFHPRSS